MKWFGAAVRVEQFEDGDRLRFRVTSERRLVALILPMLVVVGLLVYAWEHVVDWLVLVGALALIGFPVWRWFEVRVTELRVTELELVVEGDFGATADTRWLPWSDVTSLQYLRPEEGWDGVYAQRSSASAMCLLPSVSDMQAVEIIRAIYSRFPYVAVAEASGPPSLFGETE